MNHKLSVSKQNVLERRLIRWISGLLGGVLLVVGLILNAKAQVSASPEDVTIHTFRPVLKEEGTISGGRHPAATLAVGVRPARIANPTAHADRPGLSCQDCHLRNRTRVLLVAESPGLELHPLDYRNDLDLAYDCEICHPAQGETG